MIELQKISPETNYANCTIGGVLMVQVLFSLDGVYLQYTNVEFVHNCLSIDDVVVILNEIKEEIYKALD